MWRSEAEHFRHSGAGKISFQEHEWLKLTDATREKFSVETRIKVPHLRPLIKIRPWIERKQFQQLRRTQKENPWKSNNNNNKIQSITNEIDTQQQSPINVNPEQNQIQSVSSNLTSENTTHTHETHSPIPHDTVQNTPKEIRKIINLRVNRTR